MTRPPIAERIPYSYTRHGITVEDPYAWLKDPGYPNVTDPRILDYLRAENAYFEARMAPYKSLVETLFEELKARQPQEDAGVPYRKDGYWYQWRFEHGAQYRIWLRAPVDDTNADAAARPPAEDDPAWQVILDEPRLAEAHDYFVLGGLSVSPNGRYLAWSADINGSERFTLHVKDLTTGTLLDEPIPDTLGSPEWAADSERFLYVLVNEQWRPYQVRLHHLGTPRHDDPVVYEETDEAFFVGIDKTSSEAYLLISTGDHVTSEVRWLPADAPDAEPRLFAPRRAHHEYSVDHGDGHFYFLSNAAHKNFALLRAPEQRFDEAHWEPLVSGSDAQYLTWFARFRGRVLLGVRIDGLDQVRVMEDAGDDYLLEFPETAHAVAPGANPEYDTPTFRLQYESMITPETVFDFHFDDRRFETLKERVVPTGYDRSRFATERLTAPARDGARVPVSLVYRRDTPLDGSAPLYLTGYGAYGMAIMPGFSSNRLSLLERGFVFAIAHIRGGDDLGYAWYEDGKLDKRTNTFNDFVDCARFLVEQGYTRAGRIAIAGGSAGGELMGAAVNQAPELWGAVAAHVPFVDVLNTMQDTTLPLTPIEWPEWGNPIEDKAAFETIRAYAPYEQLAPGAYPPMLLTAGLNDPRVTYWEPAKYVAKLRTLKTDDNWLLLKTNMDAGHSGQSGRFESLRELAEEFAFILASLGLVEAE
ncbi:MAG: S9 family peptidase [Pseudomonadota bacterium]